jgi:predicted component of type VI protein secretion system
VRAQFVFTRGPQTGEVVQLADHSVILGASETADVVLANPDGTIGSGHVRVWRRDGEYILHQLDSFSATWVNGDRLDLRLAILEPGDEIRIGHHTLVFDKITEPEAETPAAHS